MFLVSWDLEWYTWVFFGPYCSMQDRTWVILAVLVSLTLPLAVFLKVSDITACLHFSLILVCQRAFAIFLSLPRRHCTNTAFAQHSPDFEKDWQAKEMQPDKRMRKEKWDGRPSEHKAGGCALRAEQRGGYGCFSQGCSLAVCVELWVWCTLS